MGWLPSIGIGLVTAALGCVGAGCVANKCVRWYRISSFEGGSGYYVIGMALLGIIVGLVVGIVCARVVATWPTPGFAQGLGIATATIGGLVLTAGLLAWVGADLAPTIGDNSVQLQVEIRAPKDFTIPEPDPEYGAFASVYVPRGRSQPQAELRLKTATLVDGRWVVQATVPLATSSSNKYLRAYFTKENDAMFALRISRRQMKSDSDWSEWVLSGWNVGQIEPAPEAKFAMRFKVEEVLPPPPGPTQAELQAQQDADEKAKFDAIPATAELSAWLPYTRYGVREEWKEIAIKRMMARETFGAELGARMLSEDQDVAAEAMRLVALLPQPSSALNEPVTAAGRSLVAFIRAKNGTTPREDESYLWAAEASVRFSAWMAAVRVLREKSQGDFIPELREILVLSRVRTDSRCMQSDIRRVASYYLHTWTGLEPAPDDPKPR